MNLRNQRRMAAEILKCGVNRVWINPDRKEDVLDAVTRSDIRTMINAGAILARNPIGISRARNIYRQGQKQSGRRRGHGSRRGGKNARTPSKRQWMMRIRPVRAKLKELRDSGVIDTKVYRSFYKQAKGGAFKNRPHLETQLRLQGYLKEEGK